MMCFNKLLLLLKKKKKGNRRKMNNVHDSSERVWLCLTLCYFTLTTWVDVVTLSLLPSSATSPQPKSLGISHFTLANKFTVLSKFPEKVPPKNGQSDWTWWPQRFWLVWNQVSCACDCHYFPSYKSIITFVLIFYLSEVERIPWGLFSLFKGHDLQVHGPRWLEIN